MFRESKILFGRITKVHGYKGQMVLKADSATTMLKENMGSVFLEIDGIPVPFFIDELFERKHPLYTLKLEDVDDDISAGKLVGLSLLVEERYMESKGNGDSDPALLKGYTIIDLEGEEAGVITEFTDIPGNPLFTVSHSEGEFWLPLNEELIKEIDPGKRLIIMEFDKGLKDL